MKYAIEIKKLTKTYDSGFSLGEINLDIPSGMMIGLIGENGAGKTTLIKAILNLIHYQGEIRLFGKNIATDEQEVKENIGVVLDNMFFPEILKPKDISVIMKGMIKSWDEELFFSYLKDFQIPQNSMIKTLSKGMRKKLEIATALSHHPKLLILDEATSGLDPVVRKEVLDIFLKFISDDEHTILLSTHITSDLEQIADQIIFIDEGHVLLQEERDTLIEEYGVLKCSHQDFDKIEKEDIVTYQKNKYDCHVLVKEKQKMQRKYKNYLIDSITLEELMILMIKGERVC